MQIRKGFETNSSSSHSLVIRKITDTSLLEIPQLMDGGTIHIYPHEFGWEQDILDSFYLKASYLMSYCLQYYPEEINSKGILFYDVLRNVIVQQTGCIDVVFHTSNSNLTFDEDVYGYIDHQSWECKQYHKLFDNENHLRNFLFDKQSYLITDNDNADTQILDQRKYNNKDYIIYN